MWLIILPLLLILGLSLGGRRLMGRLALGGGLALCGLQVGLALLPSSRFWHAPQGWPGSLLLCQPVVDNLARAMLLAIGLVSATAMLAGRAMVDAVAPPLDDTRRFISLNLLLLMLAGMNGMVLANDWFTLYVFLEITSLGSCILIAVHRDQAAFEGAFKYLVLSAVAAAMILAALALLLLAAGDLSFTAVRAALAAAPGSRLLLAALVLLAAGFLIKGGLVPFHGWLPDAYTAAPAPVSILLAGMATKTTGVYMLIRLATDPAAHQVLFQPVWLVVGGLSMLLGALAALGQSDFKRLLAYSSISQMGYILLGLGAGNALGLAGAVFHLFNHAIFKAQLFINAATVEQQTGRRDLDRLGGLAERMPVTGLTAVIGCLSTAGLPPLAGFWSKLLIIIALWQAGLTGWAALAILVSLLTLAYFLVLQRRVFFGRLAAGLETLRDGNCWLLIPACGLALITIGVGLGLPWLFETFLLPIRSLL